MAQPSSRLFTAYQFCMGRSRMTFCSAPCLFTVLLRACTNGSSELMSSISMSVVSMPYNFQLLRCVGEDGVAAYGVLIFPLIWGLDGIWLSIVGAEAMALVVTLLFLAGRRKNFLGNRF